MMNKMLKFPIIFLIVFALSGCGTKNNDTNDQNANTTNSTNEQGADGQNDMNGNNDNNDNNSNNNNNTNNDMNNGLNNETKVEVADDAAEKVAAMDEVESANVLVTNQNAYVGVMLKEGTEETDELENRIADEVRNAHEEFNNVYVSFNPDFAERFTTYGEQIRAGEPVEGFIEEFNETIQRVFPNAK